MTGVEGEGGKGVGRIEEERGGEGRRGEGRGGEGRRGEGRGGEERGGEGGGGEMACYVSNSNQQGIGKDNNLTFSCVLCL